MPTGTGNTTVGLDVILALENAILHADLQTGRRILEEIAVVYGEEAVISQVIEPILSELGDLLKCQEISQVKPYQVPMIVDELLRLYRSTPRSAKV